MSGERGARRSGHQTQWAAQFAVASELCKKGHEVAFTMGNHPSVDLMAVSPSKAPFGIDVKGLYRRNYWLVSAKPVRAGLFYVLAFVPENAPNRFFVLTQEQVNAELAADMQIATERARAKGRTVREGFTGISFSAAEKYENAWGVLPS